MRKKPVNKDGTKKGVILIALSFLTILGVIVAVMIGMSSTVGKLAIEIKDTHADAILAKADVDDDTIVKAPILYYRQAKDECVNFYSVKTKDALLARQFGWSECGYHNQALEKEMTKPTLGKDYLPEALGGKLLSNRGVKGEAFERWFHEVDGKSQVVASSIDLKYDEKLVNFSYDNDEFYPFSKDTLFTFSLGIPVKILNEGKEVFWMMADDDTWVYLNDRLALDMGGIHGPVAGKFSINRDGEVYTAIADEDLAYSGIKLEEGPAVIRIFHANRDSSESVFKLSFSNMVFDMVDTTLARVDSGSDSEVAYVSEEDLAHAKPLGETSTHAPNKSRMIAASMTAQVSAVVALTIGISVIISGALRYWRRGHSRE